MQTQTLCKYYSLFLILYPTFYAFPGIVQGPLHSLQRGQHSWTHGKEAQHYYDYQTNPPRAVHPTVKCNIISRPPTAVSNSRELIPSALLYQH